MNDDVTVCPTCKGKGRIHVGPQHLDEAMARGLEDMREIYEAAFAASAALRGFGRHDLADRLDQVGAFGMCVAAQDPEVVKRVVKRVYEEET